MNIPNSIEAEQAMLGCWLSDPATIDASLEAGFALPWLFDLRHEAIAQTAIRARQSGIHVDLATVAGELSKSGQISGVGGFAYLAQLMDCFASTASLPYHLDTLREKFRLRSLLHIAVDLQTQVVAMPTGAEANALIDTAESRILSIRGEFAGNADITAREVMRSFVDRFEARLRGESDAMPTGLWNLDSRLKGGLRPKRVYVIAARPAAGKTALAVTIAASMARQGTPVGIFSLEMGSDELGDRLAAQESGVDVTSFDHEHRPDAHQFQRIATSAGQTARLPIVINDQSGHTVGSIRAISRRWARDNKARVIVIDYLTLIQGDQGTKASRREQVDAMSRGIKIMARELNIPVILLAQLNRDIEKGGGRKPKLSDLRESGAIEQDADFVGMLWMDEKAEQQMEDLPRRERQVQLQIVKNRGGAGGGSIQFDFHPTLTRFDPKEVNRPS